ncbi:MAG TPA: adenylosuccinate synthase [Dehalococcoidia bacterium]|nr:adenylosuccinate synthase [Dehalococcoidia bacterium]
MPAVVVIGGQWGDEGKGRVVDLLAQRAQVVARYSAGSNAGHTIVNELGEFRLHLVPAGIFYPDKLCLIGNGVAVDPKVLLEEVSSLEERGVPVRGRLFVSDRAHVTMPWHVLLDRLEERMRGRGAIGTTGRGVGPTFVDKVGRMGIRMVDLVDPEALRERLAAVLPIKNALLTKLFEAEPLDLEQVWSEYAEYGARLRPFVADTAALVQDALSRGLTVLLEGAQGSLLDLDLGTYEYVTSSVPSSLAGGACIGMGIGPTQIGAVVGVYKSYMTRVGNGPMPTELLDERGTMLRESGPRPEYGATTGRPRRCGWFDAVASRYTARANGLTTVALTRLDVLDRFPTINICVAYRLDGHVTDTFPASTAALWRAQPVYEELPGWEEDTSGVRRFADLPPRAQAYVRRVEELLGVPISLVSVGPEREQAIVLRDVLAP